MLRCSENGFVTGISIRFVIIRPPVTRTSLTDDDGGEDAEAEDETNRCREWLSFDCVPRAACRSQCPSRSASTTADTGETVRS